MPAAGPDLPSGIATEAQDPDTLAGPNPVIAGTAVEHTKLGDRMQFLDALRGFAAMCVVVEHSLEQLYPAFYKFSLERFRLGEFGVVVFFLCSGFIIPASLERQGSQLKFWIGRFFRLYPLYLSVLAAVLVLHYGFDKYPLPQAYLDHPVRATVANATMLQNFVSQPLALGQSWSLAYELVFYGLVSAMFVTGLHRRSPLWASLAFLTAMVVNTRHVPTGAVHDLVSSGGNRLLVITAVSLVVGVGFTVWVTRRAGPQRWMSIAIVAFAILLVLNRQNEVMSLSMFFFGTLFFGTCLFRWTEGDLPTNRLVPLTILAAVAIVVSWGTADVYWAPLPNGVSVGSYKAAEITTFLAAYAVFLVALRFRGRRFPAWILWLGTISYSLYLVHVIPIDSVGRQFDNRALDALLWVTLSIVISSVTYKLIEQPAIAMGRRWSKRAAARLDPAGTPPS
ncbi:MAG: acyltransferase family protein [Acidimicrobiia bacterium]